jgi:hypothetical protein
MADAGEFRNPWRDTRSRVTLERRRSQHAETGAGVAANDVTVSGSRVPSGATVATFERPDLGRRVRVRD